jgi:hypothetical protein
MTDASEIDAADIEGLWTEDQTAAFTHLTKNALYRHRVAGTGPAFVLVSKTRIRYRPSAVIAWAKSREFQSMAEYYAKDSARARTADLQRQAVRKVRRARWKRKSEAAVENASERSKPP